jgi:hypothetical protein
VSTVAGTSAGTVMQVAQLGTTDLQYTLRYKSSTSV